MSFFSRILSLVAGLVLVAVLYGPLGAQQLVLDNLAVDSVNERIQLRFGIQADEVQALQRFLENSGPLRMECTATLRRKRTLWLDSTVAEKRLIYDLKANPLTQTYSLINCQNQKKIRHEQLPALLQNQWSDLSMDLGPWPAQQAGSTYALELNLCFKRPDVPFWLKKALFFWSWDVISTKTYRMQFTY